MMVTAVSPAKVLGSWKSRIGSSVLVYMTGHIKRKEVQCQPANIVAVPANWDGNVKALNEASK